MAEGKQPERPGLKQAIKVYAKLQSFGKAKEEIMSKLCKMFKERIDNKTMTIDKYLHGDDPEIFDEFDTVTAVVAIDARQTRVLVTPTRADPAVDHWDELKHLAEKVTKPKGSIIVVIYGDEKSKNLPKEEIIAGEWKLTFQFNDESASHPILNCRCLSLWEEFSEYQEFTIVRYFHEIALLPFSIDNTRNVLVVGDDTQLKIFEKILQSHAFLHLRDNPNTVESGQNFYIKELYYTKFDTEKKVQVTLYCAKTDDNLPIQICDKEKIRGCHQCHCSPVNEPTETDESFELLNLCTQCYFKDMRKHGTYTAEQSPQKYFYYLQMILNTATVTVSNIFLYIWQLYQFGYVVPTIDRVILLCHDCVKCFTEISCKRNLVGSNLQRCLGNDGIAVNCDVYPLIVCPSSDVYNKVLDRMLETISSFMMEDDFESQKSFGENDKSTILRDPKQVQDRDWITKLYTMYLCHGGLPAETYVIVDSPVQDVNTTDIQQQEDREPVNVHVPEVNSGD